MASTSTGAPNGELNRASSGTVWGKKQTGLVDDDERTLCSFAACSYVVAACSLSSASLFFLGTASYSKILICGDLRDSGDNDLLPFSWWLSVLLSIHMSFFWLVVSPHSEEHSRIFVVLARVGMPRSMTATAKPSRRDMTVPSLDDYKPKVPFEPLVLHPATFPLTRRRTF
jgi:hypothetical protein